MPSKSLLSGFDTLTPFLYPLLSGRSVACKRPISPFTWTCAKGNRIPRRRHNSSQAAFAGQYAPPNSQLLDAKNYEAPETHLNPAPDSYSTTPFADACTLTLQAGAGGHGCISFLREKYIEFGPANGGDGGSGGNIYIQAVAGETSLHKLARRGILEAGRGRNGQGKSRGGERGEDVLVQVPVGTVVRELRRWDPVTQEEEERRQADAEEHQMRKRLEREREQERKERRERGDPDEPEEDIPIPLNVLGEDRGRWRRDKWLLYPGSSPGSIRSEDVPSLPRPRRSIISGAEPPSPIRLDLSTPMERPMLLAAGAMGGLGNPHFVTKDVGRPKFATKGNGGMRIDLQLELKILADVGLVGLPNAGKSTLLRALSGSRARIGNWAFTTLQPNIGTVVLDDFKGRPRFGPLMKLMRMRGGLERTKFTIADIPGLIEDAHLDRGLGLGFLRHVERAAVLAFVVDLAAGNAVQALRSLWAEVSEYEKYRDRELNEETERREVNGVVEWTPAGHLTSEYDGGDEHAYNVQGEEAVARLPPLSMPPITSKPWFVVATKADLPRTQDNFVALQAYLGSVQNGAEPHPSGKRNAWKRSVTAVPISAIGGEGTDGVVEVVLGLLEGSGKSLDDRGERTALVRPAVFD